MTDSEQTSEQVECHVAGGIRRLRAARAGRSGCDDISERVREILAAEVAP